MLQVTGPVSLVLLAACVGVAANAQPPAAKQERVHQHKPIFIPGDPIVERLRINLQQPRRVLIDPDGSRYIVDSAAGKVFKLTRQRQLSTIAENLTEPSGIARDKAGNLYISNHANGEKNAGSIVRISPKGKRSDFATKLTAPKGLAFDRNGILYAALFSENRIVKFDASGKLTEFANKVGSPAALMFDPRGNLLAVNSIAGTVSRISPKGKVSVLARGFSVPSDIAAGPDGDLIVTNYTGTQLTQILADGKTRPYMAVPEGTIGIAFDSEGNLTFANWNLHSAVKITTRLSVPCPHCNKRIPVRIRRKVPAAKQAKPAI